MAGAAADAAAGITSTELPAARQPEPTSSSPPSLAPPPLSSAFAGLLSQQNLQKHQRQQQQQQHQQLDADVLVRGRSLRPSPSLASAASTQPVLVRAYDHPDRDVFQDSMGIFSMRPATGPATNLPAVDQFSFEQILQSIEPDINNAIDAIAEICARSKMSSADSYGAHLPPQGVITGGVRRVYPAMTLRAAGDAPLDSVPEASSSSERLAGLEGSTLAGSSKGKSPRTADAESDETEILLKHLDDYRQFERLTELADSKDARSRSGSPKRTGSPTVDLTIVDATPDSFSAAPSIDGSGSIAPPRSESSTSRTGILTSWIRWPLTPGAARDVLPADAKAALDAINRPR